MEAIMAEQQAGRNAERAARQLRALERREPADIAALLEDVIEEARKRPFDTGAPVRGARGAEGVSRTGSGVTVNSKKSVMGVFLDAGQNYTVEGSDDPGNPVQGYRQRARASFGEIYLCLDKGAEYDRQARNVNAAIQSLTEADAFALALRETRKVLASNPDAAADPAGHMEACTIKILSALCEIWFDLPDTVNMVEGGFQIHSDPPGRCPADFALASGFIFTPEPPPIIGSLGVSLGRVLRQAVLKFVTDMRATNTAPQGILIRAIFANFAAGEEDLIARTIVGVMVGMLPTVDHNLQNIVADWAANRRFPELRNALRQHGGTDPHQRASAVLLKPLMQSMQGNPVPPAVWRTAAKPHVLGTSPPVNVTVGEKVTISIIDATQEDLQAGINDVFPVFGGDRSASPHPTHACPGYKAAIGIMLGVLNGLLEPTPVA
jgi:hypothetical protein